jgi:hypothetical protein
VPRFGSDVRASKFGASFGLRDAGPTHAIAAEAASLNEHIAGEDVDAPAGCSKSTWKALGRVTVHSTAVEAHVSARNQ